MLVTDQVCNWITSIAIASLQAGVRAGPDFSQPLVNSEPRTVLGMVGFWSAFMWSCQVEKLCRRRRNHPGERAPVHVGLKRFPTGLLSIFKATALCSVWETLTLICLLSPTTFLPQRGLNWTHGSLDSVEARTRQGLCCLRPRLLSPRAPCSQRSYVTSRGYENLPREKYNLILSQMCSKPLGFFQCFVPVFVPTTHF